MTTEIAQAFMFERIKKLELSHSSRSSFRTCPRKLEFRKVHHNSRRSESYAGNAGSALHNGIQDYAQYKDVEKAVWEMMKAFPIKYQKSWSDERSLAACYTTLKSMMNWEMMDRYELAYLKKPDGTLVPATEVPFILRISEFPFFPDGGTICVDYIGFMDFILYDKLDDQHVVTDLKTTTRTVDHVVEFRFSEQCLPYGLVLESVLGNELSRGFEVDYWSAYINAVEPKNQLLKFHKTQEDIRDWMQGYLFDLDAIRRYYNLGWFARNGNACLSWNRPCVFWDFCETRDPKVINAMLAQDAENQVPFVREEPWIVIELNYQDAA